MKAYYVTHPLVGLTATIYAPTSEKARTAYLDYLERTGRIRRSVRKLLRSNLVAQHMESSTAMPSDVTLDYSYASSATSQPLSAEEFVSREVGAEGIDAGQPLSPVAVQSQEKAMSPLEQAVLGKYV